ncbi:MAG TPA: hypothetical protein VFM54_18270 [Micromonosporaceae bacterium]|nr:hypothetical protein [Micromonosporaceae bacterium]
MADSRPSPLRAQAAEGLLAALGTLHRQAGSSEARARAAAAVGQWLTTHDVINRAAGRDDGTTRPASRPASHRPALSNDTLARLVNDYRPDHSENLRRLVHALTVLDTRDAAALLGTVPVGIAAQALAALPDEQGQQVAAVLDPALGIRLVRHLRPLSEERRRLRRWLSRLEPGPRTPPPPPGQRFPVSALDELANIINTDPHQIRQWTARR